MKKLIKIGLLSFVIVVFYSCSEQKKSALTDLSGKYLGQSPPGMQAEIFAPGIVSTGYGERIAAFTPDAKEFYYVLTGAPHSVILVTKEINGKWTNPEVASFSGTFSQEFNISPDGNTILFIPKPFTNEERVWMVKRVGNKWGEPKKLPSHINGYPSIASNGSIYFNALNEKNNSWDVYRSEFINGQYQKPVNLGSEVNNEYHEADPFIAPDESYLIFARKQPDTFGGADLFICFRKADGTWAKAINMGENINSGYDEYCPTVSPDGKYFFFMSYRKTFESKSEIPLTYEEKLNILNSPGNGNSDIYWIDAKIIEALKPKDIK